MFTSWFRGDPINARWNFFAMGSDMAVFNLGLGIASAYAILPLFVTHLTHLNWVVAAIPAIRQAGQLIPPLFVAGFAERLDRAKPIMMRLTLPERLPFLGLAILLLVLPQGHDVLLLVLFFLLLGMQNVGAGLSYTPWLDIISRVIPMKLRGRFFGGWTAIGNAVATGGTALAAAIVIGVPWPENFAIVFGLTFVAVTISYILLALTREPPRIAHRLPVAAGSAWRRLGTWSASLAQVIREDKIFRIYLVANAVSGLATLGSGLLAVASLRQAHLTVGQVGLEGTILQVVLMLGFFGWGWLADRRGHRQLLIWGSVCSAVAMMAAALAQGMALITLSFIAFGLATSATLLAQLSYVIEFGTPARRPVYIGLAYLSLAPFSAGAPLLGGILADRFGYGVSFTGGALISIAAALIWWLWVRDPQPAAAKEPALQLAEA